MAATVETDNKHVRVLAKDKVYRNIFTAECDVNKALTKERKVCKPAKEPVLPVLKQPTIFSDGNSILSERQKTWVQANANEPFVENPTYNKYLKQDEQDRTQLSESYIDAQEVRGLPDNSRKRSSKSKVIEKVQENRKERHDTMVEELHQELGIISSDLEPCLVEASKTVKEQFKTNDNEFLSLMNKFNTDEDLINFKLNDLHQLWQDISETTEKRLQFIRELDKTFDKIENDRYERVCETLKRFNEKLESISFLMPSDVHRFIESEAEEINSTMILNRKAYADLVAILNKGTIEQDRKYYHFWQTRMKTWKELQISKAVEKFSCFMTSQEMKQPPGVLHQLECLRKEQDILNTKRLEILNSLREMKPPGASKASVYQWNNALGHETDKLEKVNKKYKDLLQVEYAKVIESCYERMNLAKANLENEDIVHDEELEAIMNESYVPLIGEKKTRFDTEMDIFERTIDNLATSQDNLVRSLFKFTQGAAHLWDSHEIDLAKQERSLQEELDDRRHRHDGTNQVKEANLDIIMDRMRQDSTKQALTNNLNQAFSLLEDIKNGYKTFHTAQLECVRKYPHFIQNELFRYDQDVCYYFSVDRNKTSLKKMQQRKTPTKPIGRLSRETSSYASTLEEVLKTSNGTTFYVTQFPGEYESSNSAVSVRSLKTSMTFLTDQQDFDDYNTLYTEKMTLDEELFVDLKKCLRMQFLESLEKWRIEAIERSNSVVAAKVEELNSELDLRLHLHKPRCARAEQDVHNVRAAELVLHQERVDRHSKGIIGTLTEFKNRFQTLVAEHNEETEQFKKTVQGLESTFTSATKTHELLSIQDQVSGQVEEYMNTIRTSLRKFRQDLDGMLSSLRNSNARFRKSFKVFSDGGNYSVDEIEEYRKRLERMANKIDQSEGFIMGELEGMESKRLETALDYAGKLEDRFKHHLFDVTFVEKVSRWITNTQVKIKSEVAESNSQTKEIASKLKTLERYIDGVRNPNLDKEQVTTEDIKRELVSTMQLFFYRTLSLDCLLVDHNAYYTILNIEPPQVEGKNGRLSSKAGVVSTASSPVKLQVNSESPQSTEGRPQTMPLDNVKKLTIKSSAHSAKSPKTSYNRSAVKREFLTRFDKKYLVFGEKSDREPKHFTARVLHILRHSLEGVLATAEAYYRQKGLRAPTRRDIHDNFDICAQAMIQRLTSYKSQAENYHNSCLLELENQLTKFSAIVVDVPSLIVGIFSEQFMRATQHVVAKTRKDNEELVALLEEQKKKHERSLRPTLGHPKNRTELENLKEQEKERMELRLKNIKDFSDQLKGYLVERGALYVEHLTEITNKLLQMFDGIICIDYLQRGEVETKPKSTKQLLLEKTKPAKNEPDIKPRPVQHLRIKVKTEDWQCLPSNELVLQPQTTPVKSASQSFTTTRTTPGHLAVIEARNKEYNDYKAAFFECLRKFDEEEEACYGCEERWQENWKLSLERIQKLY